MILRRAVSRVIQIAPTVGHATQFYSHPGDRKGSFVEPASCCRDGLERRQLSRHRIANITCRILFFGPRLCLKSIQVAGHGFNQPDDLRRAVVVTEVENGTVPSTIIDGQKSSFNPNWI